MNGTLPDTFWTTQEELVLFGGSCLLGIPAGLLFDLWRILRRAKPHPVWLVAVEDVLWAAEVGVLLLCYAGACDKGVFRGYFAIGCGIGFVLYECTVGRAVTTAVTGLLRILWMPVGKGFALICEKVRCIFVRYAKNEKKEEENAPNRLQNPIEKVYNKLRTQKEREDKWQKKQND